MYSEYSMQLQIGPDEQCNNEPMCYIKVGALRVIFRKPGPSLNQGD